MNPDDRLPPNEPLMEKAVIGCIMEKPELADLCLSRFKVGAEVFYDIRARNVFNGLLEMRRGSKTIDISTINSHFSNGKMESVGGVEFLMSCLDAAVSTANFDFYADRVSESYTLRKTMAACLESVSCVYENQTSADELITQIEKKLTALRDNRGGDEIVSASRASTLLNEHLEEKFNLQGKKSGIETGLYDLDNITDGLQASELSIIGARPSQGKTALATTIVHHACFQNKIPTLFITLEMSIPALCRRILSKNSRIGMKELRRGTFDTTDFGRIALFKRFMSDSPIYFLDSIGGTDVNRICGAINRMVKSSGIKLVVVDYLQKIKAGGKHEKRTYEVAEVSTALKSVAVKTGAAILALAQLNREPDKEKNRHPRISDLADSSQIERDADLIGLLHRDRSDNGGREASLIIAKQRDGELGVCELIFEGRFASFENKSNLEDKDAD